MAAMNGHSTAKLSADDVDDLIYACRTNAIDELKQSVSQLANQLSASEANIIASAIDVDEDGLGSRTCLLHYPAANGNVDMVNYLLETLQSQSSSTNGTNGSHAVKVPLTNHQNVSGNTPLHWAALNGHLEVVQALVQHGADPTIVNEAGRDVVVEAEYSSKESAAECATWLLKECDALESGTGAGPSVLEAEADRMEESGLSNGDEEDISITAHNDS